MAAEIGAPATPISAKPDGTLGDGDSANVATTPDGRYAVFSSNNPDLVGGDINGLYDAFRRDLQTGATELVSKKTGADTSANGQSNPIGISSDGRYVLFTSFASDVDPPDSDPQQDMFVRDMQTGITELVSVNAAGTSSGDAASTQAVMTPDGRYVAFASDASDLAAPDTDAQPDVFVRDTLMDTTELVSVNAAGTASGDHNSFGPLITPDGRFIAFFSAASDLTATTDTAASADIFIRDMTDLTTEHVSVNAAGTAAANAFSTGPSGLTPDGRYVVFISQASDITGDTNNNTTGSDVYRRDVATNSSTLVSVNAAGTGTGNAPSTAAEISDDGRYVAFDSLATDLGPPGQDVNGAGRDIFWRDLAGGPTQLVSKAEATGASGNADSTAPQITADGRYVAYETVATDILDGPVDDNGADPDIYRFDTRFGAMRLISVSFDRGAAAQGFGHRLVDDGSVAYTSNRANVVPPGQDTGTAADVFLSRNAPPVVAFTAAPESGDAPLTVAFEGTAADEGPPAAFEWEFGDGATASGPSVSHTYLVAGTYTAKLTVRDRDGSPGSATRSVTVSTAPAGPQPPIVAPPNLPPLVTAFSFAPARFAVAPAVTTAGRRARPVRRGTTIRYTLSESASASITLHRARPGRRSGGRCVRPTRRLRSRRRCTRYVLVGRLTFVGTAGANRQRFTGRIGRRALRRGRYRGTIVATDGGGASSAVRRARFRVVRR